MAYNRIKTLLILINVMIIMLESPVDSEFKQSMSVPPVPNNYPHREIKHSQHQDENQHPKQGQNQIQIPNQHSNHQTTSQTFNASEK